MWFRSLRTIKETFGVIVFSAIRVLEHLLSPDHLYAALLPFAFVRAALAPADPLPGYFRVSRPAKAARKARVNYLLSRLLEFFPERLATTKWENRFRIDGLDHILQARANGRHVILVCFHFGVYKLVPFLLRARGVPVIAVLGGKSEERSRVKHMKDRLSPFPEIPTVLYCQDQLRQMIELLSEGHLLLIAADRQRGKQMSVPIENDWSFSMATGAFRLASRYGAELIPCWMMDRGHWNFQLKIGPAVPRQHLGNGSDMHAGQYLLEQMLPQVRNHTEECASYLLNCFQHKPADCVVETR